MPHKLVGVMAQNTMAALRPLMYGLSAIRKYNGGTDAARRYYDDPGRDEIAKRKWH